MGATALKKLCREQGLSRWPFRRRRSLLKSGGPHKTKAPNQQRPSKSLSSTATKVATLGSTEPPTLSIGYRHPPLLHVVAAPLHFFVCIAALLGSDVALLFHRKTVRFCWDVFKVLAPSMQDTTENAAPAMGGITQTSETITSFITAINAFLRTQPAVRSAFKC